MFKHLSALIVASLAITHLHAADPIKVLLITGGCCHDYKTQKDLIKSGLEERANIIVDQIHVDDTNTKPNLPIYGKPDYAKGYDVVIHDECAADINDPLVIEGVLKPHADGTPAVNLHCAMHSYRFGDFRKPVDDKADNSKWYEYLGLQSTGHGPQLPVEIKFTDPTSAITKGMQNWTTTKEELYNVLRTWPTAKTLATGKQGDKADDQGNIVVWTNEYGEKKTRVFSTSIGHNNETVADTRYLDLVTRGVLWATNHLNEDGTPAEGYSKK